MKYSILSLVFVTIFCSNSYCQAQVDIPNCNDLPPEDCLYILDSIESVIPNITDSLLIELKKERLALFYNGQGSLESLIEEKNYICEYYLKVDSLTRFLEFETQYIYYLMDEGDLVSCEKELRYTEEKISNHPKFGKYHECHLSSVWGNLYEELQNFDASLEKRLETLSITKELYPENSINVAHAYTNVGITYSSLQMLEKANEFQQKGYEISSSILPETDYGILLDLYNLGILNYRIGNNKEAKDYFTKVVDVLEAQGDNSSILYQFSSNGIGSSLYRMEEYEEAYSIHEKNLANSKSLFLSGHELQIIYNKANTASAWGKEELAFIDYEVFLERYIEYFKYNTEIFTQEELINSFQKYEEMVSAAAIFSTKHDNRSDKVNSLLYDIILMEKAFGLEREISIKKYLSSKSSIFDESYEKWKKLRVDLKNAYSSKIENEIDVAESNLKQLNKELLLSGLSNEIKANWISATDIQHSLEEDEIAIEFFKLDISQRPDLDSIPEYGIDYMAMIASKKSVMLVPLFDDEQIVKAFENTDRRANFVNNLYSSPNRGVVTEGKVINLYQLIVKPLLPHLENVRTIYYSPEGLLHRINLAAININDEQVLGDVYDLHLYGSTRNLISKIYDNEESLDKTALLLGGLEFGLQAENSLASRGDVADTWPQLNHTLKEVAEIGAKLENYGFATKIISNEQGDEGSFKNEIKNGGPDILHMATHGFFIEKNDSKNSQSEVKNPMMRSGLIMSNGNLGWNGILNENRDDNILMAEEILDLDLSNTQLVVLSACESGLGDISNLEGVFGLQRAFKIAGAKYIIMSLWQVPDRQTKDFMNKFYEHLSENNFKVREAFTKTQREMKERFYDPYSWAGFVLIE